VAEGKTGLFASQDDRVGWRYLNERAGLPYQEGMWTICRQVQGRIVGAVGFTDFNGCAAAFHIALEAPLTREFLWQMFRVPFEQWGLNVLLAGIPESNTRSLNLGRRLGFEEFAMIPRAHPQGGVVFMNLYREKCRWLQTPRRGYGQSGK
jgi:RimJ/RimL family protein N-acetyltransferase